jgi:translation initiation factor 2 beta subunit (eIF-2beta)/eIF-5
MSNDIYRQRAYSAAITKWAAYYGQDPEIVYKVIEQESGWTTFQGDKDKTTGQYMSHGPMHTQQVTIKEAVANGSLPEGVDFSPNALNDIDRGVQAGCGVLDYKRKVAGISQEDFAKNPAAQKEVLTYYNGYVDGSTYADKVMTRTVHKDDEGNYTPPVGDAPLGGIDIPGSAVVGSKAPASSSSASNRKISQIVKFVSIIESQGFINNMQSGLEIDGEVSLHEYLKRFLGTFYHDIYYIPTLPDSRAIVVKPETWFIDPPSCNIIYPSIRSSSNYSRDEKSEPTRILMSTNAVLGAFKSYTNDDLNVIHTIVFLEKDPKTGEEKLIPISTLTKGAPPQQPMGYLTEFEKLNGIRISTSKMGTDLYMFLLSGGEKVQGKYKIAVEQSKEEEIAEVLGNLAGYALMRSRYASRPGNVVCLFNPYIVPGFPAVSFETANESSLDVSMYVTSVVHHITDSSISTTVSFNASHNDSELKPNVFPILEEEYVSELASTYKKMLGDVVTQVKDPKAVKKEYAEGDPSVTAALKKIWRPITTMTEYLKDLANGATVSADKGYIEFKGEFFRSDIQDKVRKYTEALRDRVAFHDSDVR